jgi:hypothetical protein
VEYLRKKENVRNKQNISRRLLRIDEAD